MNESSPKIIISKLVVVGHRKNYIVPFNRGLNIIYGDSDTGKSSILNLIDYCFGSNEVEMYNELQLSGKYCLLEVTLNGKEFTIKRDIFNNKNNIEVFYSNIDEMNSVFPLEYGPNYTKKGPEGFFSDFLMQALNIPLIRVKQAPSKENSPLIRLGFRDIFKFCSLDQDEVGNKNMLENKNGVVFTKNKETFKFLNNILDTQITQLQGEISDRTTRKNELEKKYSTISSFLNETQIKSSDLIEEEIYELNSDLKYIEEEINKLNLKMTSSKPYFNGQRELIHYLDDELNKLDEKRYLLERLIEQNQKLNKDYEKDINKLKLVKEVKLKLVKEVKTMEAFCPLCNSMTDINELNKEFSDNNDEVLKIEINALKRRKKNLVSLIDKQINDMILIDNQKKDIIDKLNNVRSLIDKETEKIVSPYISQRDGVISQKAKVLEKKSKLEYLLKIRKQLDIIQNNINILTNQIDELNEKLGILKENAPSSTEILSEMSVYLKGFLDFVKIKNATDISISSKSFLPIIRNRDYAKLTSGGLRTIVSVGYFISLLKKSMNSNTNLPSFLMIDTIGKYLGKTKLKYLEDTDIVKDKEEGIGDSNKYSNMYQYLINMCEKTYKDKELQIIIVDNDIPDEISDVVKKYVVKKFSTEGKVGFDIGFIDDYTSI